jgi:hypothetical protein
MNIFDLLEIDPATPADKLRARAAEKRQYFADLAKVAPTRTLADLYTRRLAEIDRFLEQGGGGARLAETPTFPRSEPAPAAWPTPPAPDLTPLAEFVLEPIGTGRAVRLSPGLNIVGREPRSMGNPIVIADEFVSKNHAVLEVVAGPQASVHLYDIGEISDQPSRNGVFVQDSKQRLTGRIELKDGDRIAFGRASFVLRQVPGERPARTPVDERGENARTFIIKAPYR